MSRTDKDMPFWASAKYYEPSHHHQCINTPASAWRMRGYHDQPCNLPEQVVRHPPLWRGSHDCTWEPDWDELRHHRHRYTRGPNSKERRLMWWGPDRAKTRANLTEAKKQYNDSREVEIVERAEQHRHSPSNGWWD